MDAPNEPEASEQETGDTEAAPTPEASQGGSQESDSGSASSLLRQVAHIVWAIWLKLNDDWIFNLASLVAYNLLMSIVPIVLVLLAVAGFVLNANPAAQKALVEGIVRQLPPGVGSPIVESVIANLTRTAGPALLFGLGSALFLGSRLFICIEDCFGIIFGLRGREPVQQNLMAIGMVLVYLVLLPLVFVSPGILDALASAMLHGRTASASGNLQIAGVLATFLSGILLFGSIYVIVPNRRVRWREVWKGTLVAAALLVLYRQVFPFYQEHFLTPTNPGSLIGLILITLIFFYYLAFILLLGAEVNAWAYGRRERRPPVDWVLRRR
jgi:membrane protein